MNDATVVVTGVGAITAVGRTARETFDRLLRGERGFRPLTLFEAGAVRTSIVAEVPDVVASTLDPSSSRTSELALIAAREALRDAEVDLRGRRVGLVLGGTTAGMLETESTLATLLSHESGGHRESALAKMLSHPLSAPTDKLARDLGPFDRVRSLSSACSGGANAVAIGATWLELDLVDVVLCGAADALCRVTLNGFSALAALDPEGARPFDVRRRGLTLGEGGAMLVLERARDARARDRRPICAILGWGTRSEAHHITNPEASGDIAFRAMRAALDRAGLAPGDVDYVNAHGTGTPLNDPMESRALGRLFGDDLARVPVSSQKGMIGHTLAAAGAVEAVITALAIQRGIVPPTGGLEEPDPACPLRHVLAAEERPVRAAISSAFGFGGMDTALVLGRADQRTAGRAAKPRRALVVTGVAAVTPSGVLEGVDVADLPEQRATASTVTLAPELLDDERARRLDRASRLAPVRPSARSHATAEFMRRLRDKGARMVRPADFPSLVPSSPAGHVSIYLGLRGPAFVVADLAASGECAVLQACELIAAGDADRVCAGAVEERSAIVEEVLSVVFGTADERPRREGAAAIALAAADTGLPALARLGEIVAWSEERGDDPLRTLPAPPDGAIVVVGGMTAAADEIVARTSWAGCPRVRCADAAGAHEAAGGMAIAVAAAKVARGDAPAALFVGTARGSAYAGTVWPA